MTTKIDSNEPAYIKSACVIMSASSPSTVDGKNAESVTLSFSPSSSSKQPLMLNCHNKFITFTVDPNLFSFIKNENVTVQLFWQDTPYDLDQKLIEHQYQAITFPVTAGANYTYKLTMSNGLDCGSGNYIAGDITVRDPR